MELSQSWKDKYLTIEDQTLTNTFINSSKTEHIGCLQKGMNKTSSSFAKLPQANSSNGKKEAPRIKWIEQQAEQNHHTACHDLDINNLRDKVLLGVHNAASLVRLNSIIKSIEKPEKRVLRRGSSVIDKVERVTATTGLSSFAGSGKGNAGLTSSSITFKRDHMTQSTTIGDGQIASIGSASKADNGSLFVKPAWRRNQGKIVSADTSNFIDNNGLLDDQPHGEIDMNSKKKSSLGSQISLGARKSSNSIRQMVRSSAHSRVNESGELERTINVNPTLSTVSAGSDTRDINPARPMLNKNSSLKSLKMSRGRSDSREGPIRSDSSGIDSSKISRGASTLNRSMDGLWLSEDMNVDSSRSFNFPKDGADSAKRGSAASSTEEEGLQRTRSLARPSGFSKEILKTNFIVKRKPKSSMPS